MPITKEFLSFTYKGWFDYEKPTNAEIKPLNINIFGNVANVYYIYKYDGEKIKKPRKDIGNMSKRRQ